MEAAHHKELTRVKYSVVKFGVLAALYFSACN